MSKSHESQFLATEIISEHINRLFHKKNIVSTLLLVLIIAILYIVVLPNEITSTYDLPLDDFRSQPGHGGQTLPTIDITRLTSSPDLADFGPGSGQPPAQITSQLPAVIGFSQGSVTIPEGANETIEIQLDEVTDTDVVVHVTTSEGTAHAGTDFDAIDLDYTIPANSTSVSVPVFTRNDNKFSSPDLTFSLLLSMVSGNATAGTSSVVVNIGEANSTPVVGWDTSALTISEGSTASAVIQLSGLATSDITVDLATHDGTAIAGRDYTGISQQYVIPAGSGSVPVALETLNDGKYSNPNLTFTASLSVATGPATAGTSTLTIDISETSTAPVVSFSTDSLTIPEGNSDSITVQLSGLTTSDVTIDVATGEDTAHAGSNYHSINRQYTINAGSDSVAIPIETVNDNQYSNPDLRFRLSMSIATGPATGSGTANVTISEASSMPTVGWQSTAVTANEGTTGSATVQLSGAVTSDVTVSVTTSDGTAHAGTNYNAIPGTTYTIPAGSLTVGVPFTTLNDDRYSDTNSSFNAVLALVSGPATTGTSSTTIEIGEMSTRPVVSWQSGSTLITEGTTGSVVAQLSGPATTDVIISVTTSNNTACAGIGYTAISQQFTISAGNTSIEVPVETLNDNRYSDPNLAFAAGLSLVTGPATVGSSTMTISIGETSERPLVGFSADPASVPEGSSGTIEILLSGVTTTDVVVRVATSDGTAHAGTNYNTVNRQYTVPAGTTSVPVTITTLNDSKYSDPDLAFTAGLSMVSGPASTGTDTKTVNIGEGSARPVVSWQSDSVLITEGTSGSITAVISGVTTSDVVIHVTTSDGTATQGTGYAAIDEEYHITAGNTSVVIPVLTIDDHKYSNPNLAFGLGLAVSGGPASGSSSSTITIDEVSTKPAVAWDSASSIIPEGTTGTVNVQLTAPVTTEVVVHVTTSNLTGKAGIDYTPVDDDFTITAGATCVEIPITTLNDHKYSNPNRTFRATLSYVSGPTMAGTQMTTTLSVGEASPKPVVSWQTLTTDIPEGTTTPVLVSLSGPTTSDVVVKVITSDDTAEVGINYNAIGQLFTIPAGETSVNVPVTTLNDNMYSYPNLTFTSTLTLVNGPVTLSESPTSTMVIGEANETPTISFSTSALTVPEGTSRPIQVKLSGVTTFNVAVRVTSVDGTASAGTGYTAIDQEYTIPSGSTSVTIPVATVNDNRYSNPNLQYRLGVSVADGHVFMGSPETAIITIAEASPMPSVGLQSSSLQIAEGASGSTSVMLSAVSTSDVVVRVRTINGTARSDTGYTAFDQQFTITAGTTSVPVPVQTLNDNKYSNPNLTFALQMNVISGQVATGRTSTTIVKGEVNETPTVSFTSETYTIPENATGSITIGMSGPATSDVKVIILTSNDTAHYAIDYEAVGKAFTIPAGETSVEVPVTTVDDGKYSNPDLQFIANLAQVTGPAAIGTPNGTVISIGESHSRPTVGWTSGTAGIREGTTGYITLRLSGLTTADVVAHALTTDGTAHAGSEYTTISQDYTIPAGSTSVSIPVPTQNNGIDDNPELQFSIALGLVSGPATLGTSEVTVTINDHSASGGASLLSGSSVIPEGTTDKITVQLSEVAASDVTIHAVTVDGTAHAGSDYSTIGDDFIILAGTSSVDVPVTTLNDYKYSNPNRTFSIGLGVVSGPATGTGTWTVTIGEANETPVVGFDSDTVLLTEDTTTPVTIRMSGPATYEVKLIVGTSDGTAREGVNYNAIGKTYTIPAGSTTLSVPVTTVDDNKYSDPNLTFGIGISILSGIATVDNTTTTVHIGEIDPRPTVGWQYASSTIAEGTTGTIYIVLSGPMTSAETVSVTTSDNTARSGIDYNAISGHQYTIPASATSVPVAITTLNDHKYSSPNLRFGGAVSLVSGPASPGTLANILYVGEANATPVASFSSTSVEIPEGNQGSVDVRLSGVPATDVVVRVTASDNTACGGTNYDAINDLFTIPAGTKTVNVPITTRDDSRYSEPNLTFDLSLSIVSGPATGTATSTVEILESSPKSIVSWQSGPTIVTEGTTGPIYAELSVPSTSDVVVIVTTSDGTAHAGDNYVRIGKRFTIPAGESSVAVPVTTRNDNKYSDPNLTLNATLSLYSGPANLGITTVPVQIGEINDTPVITFSAPSLTIPEGTSGSINVQIDGVTTTNVVVRVKTTNETALAGTNYNAIDQNLTILAGSTSVNVPITTLNDNKYSNPNQTFGIEVDYVSGPATGTATSTITIAEITTRPTVSWQSSAVLIPEGTADTMALVLSGSATTDVVINVNTIDGTAHTGTNYDTISGQFTIPAGETSVEVPVTTRNDSKYSNPNQTFTANMSVASGPATGSGNATVTIGEGSSRPTICWEYSEMLIQEATTGSIHVLLSNPATTDVVVNVATADGTAHAGTNFNTISNQYTISAGETSVNVPVTTLNDNKYSNPDQTFGLNLNYVSGPASAGTPLTATVSIGEISPMPTVEWEAGSVSISEDTTGNFKVALSGPATTDVVVRVNTQNGNALAGTNYNSITGGQYIILAGNTYVSVPITTVTDNKYSNPSQQFYVNFSLVSGPATRGSNWNATVTINEVSGRPTVRWSASTRSLTEGNTGSLTIQLTPRASTTDVVVSVTTSDSTAHAGTNYNAITTQQYTIPAGSTSIPVSVTTLNDSKYSSPNLQFTAALSYVSGPASAGTPLTSTVTITEASTRPTVSWQSGSMLIQEGAAGTNTVLLSGVTTQNVIVQVTTTNVTALSGISYTAINQQYTIPGGSTSVEVPVATRDDSRYSNPNQTFNLGLSVASGPASGSTTASVAIGETSERPTISWETGSKCIPEGTTGSINVLLSGPATTGVVVNVATSNGTAHSGTEYTAIGQQFTIPAGSTSVNVPVTTLNNGRYSNPNQTFNLGLGYVSGPASTGAPLAATVEINETSARPVVSMQASSVRIPEGTTGSVVIWLSGAATTDVVLDVTTADGTAHAGTNYDTVTMQYTIPAGTTSLSVPVTTRNDHKYSNPNQTFDISFGLVSGPVTEGSTMTTVEIGEASLRPTVSWQSSPILVPESTPGTAVIQLSNPTTADVVLDVTTADGTAYAGTNYEAIAQQYTIPAGLTSVPVTVTTLDDSQYSNPNQTFTLGFTLSSGPVTTGNSTAIVNIGEASPMPTLSWQTGEISIPEESLDALVILLSGPATTNIVVDVVTSDKTAHAGTGFTGIDRQYTIPAGETSVPVTVTTLNDHKYSDPNLTFNVSFSRSSGPATGSDTARVTINETSTRPIVSWEASSGLILEDTTGEMNIVLSGPATSAIVVSVTTTDGTGHAGTNYDALNSQFTIPAGSTMVPVSLTTRNDHKYSNPNLTFNLSLGYVSGPASAGSPLASTIQIGEMSTRPIVGWQSDAVTIEEDSTEAIAIQLDGPATTDVVLNVTTHNGTAGAGTNYAPIDRQYTIPAGQTEVSVSVTTGNDHKYSNPNQTFDISLTLASGPVTTGITDTIVSIGEADQMPVVSMRSAAISIPEDSTGSAIIDLSMPVTTDIVLDVATHNGTAGAGTNYAPIDRQYTITAGSTNVSVPVETLDDHRYSNPNQTFDISLTLATGPAITGSSATIVDIAEKSSRPFVSWPSASVEIPEGTTQSVSIPLSYPTTTDVVVHVTTSDGTARAGINYAEIGQDLTVPAGSSSISLPITTLNDHRYSNPNLTFNASLQYVSGPAQGGATLLVRIGEANETPLISFDTESIEVPEGENSSVTVLMSGLTTTDVVVNVTTANETARADIEYTPVSREYTIPAGENSVIVPLTTLNDHMYSNPNLTFEVVLTRTQGPAAGNATSIVTITEANETPVVTWQSESVEVPENTTGYPALLMSGITTTDVTVNLTTGNGTAQAGTNYLAISREFTIPAGATMVTVPVTTLNDSLYSNPNQTFNLSMAVANGPATGSGNATVTIGESSPVPTLSWKHVSVEFIEGVKEKVIIELSQPTTFNITFNVTTSDGSATSDENYNEVNRQFCIPAGNKSIEIPIILLNDNRYTSSNKQFTIGINQVFGPVVLSQAISTVIITEVSSPPGIGMDDVDWPLRVEGASTEMQTPDPTGQPTGNSQSWSADANSSADATGWLQENKYCYCCCCCLPVVLVLIILLLVYRRRKKEEEEKEEEDREVKEEKLK